jgi:superfamily II DNA/RNA helicase
MKRFDAGITGDGFEQEPLRIDGMPSPWPDILAVLIRGNSLRPLQQLSISQTKILETRQHLVICAPTNSGKSLVGHLILLDAVLRGRRAILLEPLRVLAQEQYEILSDAVAALSPIVFKASPRISLSTGDYRLEGELPTDPPSRVGEIIVATPERLDAILRNPDNADWSSSIGALVVDEAHLISDPRRGPTLELLVASMLSMKAPPRIALLSATVGEPQKLQQWLQPCQILTSNARTPLRKEVWALSKDEDPDEILAAELAKILNDPSNAAIVFVYRRGSAEALARKLPKILGLAVLSFHSGLSRIERSHIRSQFVAGSCRCLIATTALAMGVNLPATHVLIRDTTFYGFGQLRIDEILQTLGRAGRGDRPGYGNVLIRPTDNWSAEELSSALLDEVLPPLRSSFERPVTASKRQGSRASDGAELAAVSLIATCLGRSGTEGLSVSAISRLLANTLGGEALTSRADAALRWLCEPARLLAYKDDNDIFHLTFLGRTGVRSMLPLSYVAALGLLTRDLMSLDPNASLLRRWSPLDHLFLIALLSERTPRVRRFSEPLASQIDGWIESRPMDEKSMLFVEWVMGSATASKADELLGSLGVSNQRSASTPSDTARKQAYCAMLGAILLDERSRGVSIEDIERRWGIAGFDGLDEGWRDTALWMLAGHAAIFEIRSFYYHLQENCSADPGQTHNTKHALGRMRSQTYDLLEQLKYTSPLGSMLRGIRASLRGLNGSVVGVGTIRKLEASGISTLREVSQMKIDDLVRLGIATRFAKQIIGYSRRRLR